MIPTDQASTDRLLYRAEGFPVFQNRMYETAAGARDCPRGDIHLVEDGQTGLVHNAAFDPRLVTYDTHYQNEQGLSPAFRGHLASVVDLVMSTMQGRHVVEVGSGKGGFLNMLAGRGLAIRGYDPAYEGDDPRIVPSLFRGDGTGQAGGFILRHVLEHIPNPVGFLQEIAAANGGQGLIYLEVPCLDWICETRAWYDIFYEHVNYFRLADFQRMFGRVLHADRGFGGQYLRVVADLSSLRVPSRQQVTTLAFPNDMAPEFSREAPLIWGAGSKGVVYALLRHRSGKDVLGVVDINPAKQGYHLAATGLQVEPPEIALARTPPGTPILVMNPMYLDEVRGMSGRPADCLALS